MNIEAGYHTKWATVAALEALLPVANVYTGRVPAKPTRPYASIRIDRMETVGRSQLSIMRDVDIRVSIHPTSYDNGKAIHDALLDGFENTSFALTDGAVEECQHSNTEIDQADENDESSWQFDAIFANQAREDRV